MLLGLAPPGTTPVLVIVLVSVLAAFWAAEKTLEKNPDPGVNGAVVGFSGVGVRGASVVLESLLGPRIDADPDRARRCAIVLPKDATGTLGAGLAKAGELSLAEPLCSLCPLGEEKSVGVGGVFTIIGRADSDGGVRGGMEMSTFVRLLGRCDRSGEASFVSFVWGPTLLASAAGFCSVVPASVLAPSAELVGFLVLKTSLILPAGDFDRLWVRL